MAKNKNVDAMISGAGFISAFISKLLDEVRELGGTSEDVHLLVNPDGKELISQIAQFIVNAGKKARHQFMIALDPALSFADMIRAGNYSEVDQNINQENFPLDTEGKTEEEVFILHFKRDISSEQAIAEMEKQGLRPATITHALAFGAQHWKELKNPVIFLGSSWVRSPTHHSVPWLGVPDDELKLSLVSFDYDWLAPYRFAAVRK